VLQERLVYGSCLGRHQAILVELDVVLE
jgi:hypothetical protein